MDYPLAADGVSVLCKAGCHARRADGFRASGGLFGWLPTRDTDYRVRDRVSVEELVQRVRDRSGPLRWVWITGGEPTDHELMPLVVALRRWGFHLALATSGHREVFSCWDWVSVSPHDPARWMQKTGHELKSFPV